MIGSGAEVDGGTGKAVCSDRPHRNVYVVVTRTEFDRRGRQVPLLMSTTSSPSSIWTDVTRIAGIQVGAMTSC